MARVHPAADPEVSTGGARASRAVDGIVVPKSAAEKQPKAVSFEPGDKKTAGVAQPSHSSQPGWFSEWVADVKNWAQERVSLFTKLLIFVALNGAMMLWFFYLIRFGITYLGEDKEITSVETIYNPSFSLFSEEVILNVNDYYLPIAPALTPALVSQFKKKVHLLSDHIGDPGWNLQDFMDVNRTFDAGETYYNSTTGERMVQNYRVCSSSCLSGSGEPRDFVAIARNYTALPYGSSHADFYLNRDWIISEADPDFYAAYLYAPSQPAYVALAYGNWGQPSSGNNVSLTVPSESEYLCNFGALRRRLTGIEIKASQCHVQITSHEGDGYKVFMRTQKGTAVPLVQETPHPNTTSNCQTFSITIDVKGSACPVSFVPGVVPSCEFYCALVIQKGANARRVPISVVADIDPGKDPSYLKIDDRYLVLDSRYPWQAGQRGRHDDLVVAGGDMVVELSNARIGRLNVSNLAGRRKLSFIRSDAAVLFSAEDNDIVIEDSRNTLVRMRNPDNHVCAAAPLVEAVPVDFMECDAATSTGGSVTAHEFYEVVADGYIDKTEFLAGIERLGIGFGEDGLALSTEEQAAVIAHVFKISLQEEPFEELTPSEVMYRLRNVLPPLTTRYDAGSPASNTSRLGCSKSCLEAGNTSTICNDDCTWRCAGSFINVSETSFGLCDTTAGCQRACGTPEGPLSRSSSAIPSLETLFLSYEEFDVSADGLLQETELRALLLHIFSNCSYRVLQSSVAAAQTLRYCTFEGPSQFTPAASDRRLGLDCSYSSGNPSNWRIQNLPAASPSVAALYGGTEPRECRPFPDYDPKLSGRQYDPTASKASCPECFLLDGSRAPPHYYNRSTWSRENYDRVMHFVHQVFEPKDINRRYLPYFNMSDEMQWSIFASKVFKPRIEGDRVEYMQFNLNIQTLSQLEFLSKRSQLFDPNCFEGMFLKLNPTYVEGDTATNLASITAASIEKDSYGIVEDARMPGFNISTSPAIPGLNPCPADWGNGTQGSTTFSYFSWANGTLGFKWGHALPEFCMDEAWPGGGTDGKFPDDPALYGSLAGMPVLPGCEPSACLAEYTADNGFGSIHVQTLPFSFDWWNATGSYQRMVENCIDADDVPVCFYKGYDDALDAHLTRSDLQNYHGVMQPCVDGDPACSDKLVIFHLGGEGVPTHQKMFWTSRTVYMQVEPPYFNIMSGTLLVPDIVRLYPRMSPGFCDAQYGAVENIDWRDRWRVGTERNAQQPLRTKRTIALYDSLLASLPKINGTESGAAGLQGNSGWYLRGIWREPYKNETLFYDPSTVDGIADTSSGYTDEVGNVIGAGENWRHRRVCTDPDECYTDYFLHRDNCYVSRTAVFDQNTSTWSLSDCVFSDGSSAYLNPALGEQGPTFNETSYYNQFAANLSEYPWYGSVAVMSAEDHLERNYLTYQQGYGSDNITNYSYSKVKITFNDYTLNVAVEDASANALANLPLFLAIVLSLVIALTCGVAAIAVIIYFGLKYLAKINGDIETAKKLKAQRIALRQGLLFEEIRQEKEDKVRVRMKKMRDDTEDDGDTEDVDITLSPEEKTEIMWLMAENNYNEANVMKWNLSQMVKIWHREVRARKALLKTNPSGQPSTPAEMYTLLQANRPGFVELPPELLVKQAKAEAKDKQGEEAKAKKKAAKAEAAEKERKAMMRGNMIKRLAMANFKRIRRFFKDIHKVLKKAFPSPFKILEQVIVSQVRLRIIDSLQTFLKVKCRVNHQLMAKEEIILGIMSANDERIAEAEQARVLEALLLDVCANAAAARHAVAEASEWPEQQLLMPGSRARVTTSGWPGAGSWTARAVGLHQDAPGPVGESADGGVDADEDLPDDDQVKFEVDGLADSGVIVYGPDHKVELYATKWVDINVHRIQLEPPKRAKPPGLLKRCLEYFAVGQDIYARLQALANGGSFGSPGSRAQEREDGAAYVVIVQEGPGATLSSKYNRFDDEDAAPSPIFDAASDDADPGLWTSRTLVLPCPALFNPDGTRQQGVVRTYCVREAHGVSYVTINTQGNGNDLRPDVEFSTTRRSFNSIYERWCHHNDLLMKDILEHEKFLLDLNIRLRKRVVPRVRGLRLLRSNLLLAMEQHCQMEEAGEQAVSRAVSMHSSFMQSRDNSAVGAIVGANAAGAKGTGSYAAAGSMSRFSNVLLPTLFGRGDNAVFALRALPDVGDLYAVRLRLDAGSMARPPGSSWHVASVGVSKTLAHDGDDDAGNASGDWGVRDSDGHADGRSSSQVTFPVHAWLGSEGEAAKTFYLMASSGSPVAAPATIEYKVPVNVQSAATDCLGFKALQRLCSHHGRSLMPRSRPQLAMPQP